MKLQDDTQKRRAYRDALFQATDRDQRPRIILAQPKAHGTSLESDFHTSLKRMDTLDHRTRLVDSPVFREYPSMNSPSDMATTVMDEKLLSRLKSRQLRLSICCAAAFLGALLALPLLNYLLPESMATRVGGFPLTWLILGVLFFPYVWLIAWIFIRKSMALEAAEVREVQQIRANATSRR